MSMSSRTLETVVIGGGIVGLLVAAGLIVLFGWLLHRADVNDERRVTGWRADAEPEAPVRALPAGRGGLVETVYAWGLAAMGPRGYPPPPAIAPWPAEPAAEPEPESADETSALLVAADLRWIGRAKVQRPAGAHRADRDRPSYRPAARQGIRSHRAPRAALVGAR